LNRKCKSSLEVLKTNIKSKLCANTELGAEITDMASANSDMRRPPHPGVDIGAGASDVSAAAEGKGKAAEKAAG
jgi:hypothetical protein